MPSLSTPCVSITIYAYTFLVFEYTITSKFSYLSIVYITVFSYLKNAYLRGSFLSISLIIELYLVITLGVNFIK
jgi:hypothetical protein